MTAKILIIEDEEHTLNMLKQYLQFHEYETDGAMTGMLGLQKLKTFKPDLLLLDVMLPDMDGIVILKLLRGQPDGKHLPVIILSALGSPSSVRQGYEAGATRYLKKPIDMPNLIAEIEKALEVGRHVPPSGDTVEKDASNGRRSEDVDMFVSSERLKNNGTDAYTDEEA